MNELLCLPLNVKNVNKRAKSKVHHKYTKKKRPRAILFSGSVELEFLLHVEFFYNLLVNPSMLDFVLDPGKPNLRSRHPSRAIGNEQGASM